MRFRCCGGRSTGPGARRLPARQPQREGADRDPREPSSRRALSDPLDELFEIAMGILYLGERQRLRLFIRRDAFGRSLSCLVFVPRDRFNTENRRRIEGILKHAFRASSIDYTTRLSESRVVRLHFLVYTEPARLPEYDPREIELRLVAATRSWTDDLESALVDEYGEERGNACCASGARPSPPPTAPTGCRARPLPTSGTSSSSPRTTTWRSASTGRSSPRRTRCARRSSAPERPWLCPTCCPCSRTWAWR